MTTAEKIVTKDEVEQIDSNGFQEVGEGAQQIEHQHSNTESKIKETCPNKNGLEEYSPKKVKNFANTDDQNNGVDKGMQISNLSHISNNERVNYSSNSEFMIGSSQLENDYTEKELLKMKLVEETGLKRT